MSDSVQCGFGLDPALEKRIETSLVALTQLVVRAPGDQEVIDLVREARELTQRVRDLSGVDGADLATGEPLVESPETLLYGSIQLADVHRRWHEQQTMNAHDALCILRGGPAEILSQRVRSGLPDPVARPTALVEALGEIEKTALLLAAPPVTTIVAESEVIVSPDTSADVDNWEAHGDFELTPEQNGFRFRNTERERHDAMMWTARAFEGDHIYRTRFTPHTGPGGVIFAICGQPRPGKNLSHSARETMEPYNTGIDAYHVSVYREGTGMTNLRRPGSGLKMLATQNPDPCDTPERTYDICLLRAGRSLLFLVDGVLIHHYVDADIYGPSLKMGHIGIRHWRNTDASYGNFVVSRLETAG